MACCYRRQLCWFVQIHSIKELYTLIHLANLVLFNLGVNAAQQLAARFQGRFQVLLIEKNSHFQHIFAFPRFAAVAGVDTHKAFIPYVPGTFASYLPDSGIVIQARVSSLTHSVIKLDKKVLLRGQTLDSIPYSYLVCVG